METSLHRALKELYAESEESTEVTLGDYRIDAIRDGELIEIQFGSLLAIRPKIKKLLQQKHRVRIVKPIVHRKRIIRQKVADGPILGSRMSPKRGELLDLFEELVYFTSVFPNRRLVLEVPLVNVEHWRLPPGKKRKRWRRKNDFTTRDIILERVVSTHEFASNGDLLQLIDGRRLPKPFDTAELANHIDRPRHLAQQIAYCLRETGAVDMCGKKGNAILYRAA